MVRTCGLSIASALIALLPAAALAQAQAQPAPQSLGQFSDWEAFAYEGEQGKVCYVLSKPKQLRPADRDHGDVYFFITSRPAEGVRNEASVIVGYTFDENSTVTVDVDGTKFNMFTKADGAWVESPADEAQLLEAMRAGRQMSVHGRSSRGTDTTYDFSLSGVTASTNAILSECS